MLKIHVPDGGIGCSIEVSGLFPDVLRDLAIVQRKIYDTLPEDVKDDMLGIYTDPEYWKMVLTDKDDRTVNTVENVKVTKGRRMRWIMEP